MTGIRRPVLELILQASKECYPNEFAGQLRARGGAIHELTMLPGTLQGRSSALVNLWMLPVDFTVVGSVHSHPSGNYWPSDQDIDFFNKFGRVHIIVGAPFTLRSWRAYDHTGAPIRLDVVD
ncbi:MAG: Mov34/MPN/PAD-1 family protein [Thermoplasmatota archaeon]